MLFEQHVLGQQERITEVHCSEMAEGVQEDVATRSSLIATTVTSVWLRSVRRASRPMRPYPLIRTRSGAFFFLLNIEHTEREQSSALCSGATLMPTEVTASGMVRNEIPCG